jgi:hypothetical protein
VLRTYSLKHDKREEVESLLRAYNTILSSMMKDIWMSIRWKQGQDKQEGPVQAPTGLQ